MKFIKLIKAKKLDLNYYEDWSNEEKEELKNKLSSLSNYGLIYFDDLEELADELGYGPIELQDIALEIGYNVQ